MGWDLSKDGLIQVGMESPVRELILASRIGGEGLNYGVIHPDHPPRVGVSSGSRRVEIPLREGVQEVRDMFSWGAVKGE